MNQQYLRTSAWSIGTMLVVVVSMMWMIGSSPARAQQPNESFRATHISELSSEYVVPQVTGLAAGVAILRLDATNRTLDYRITVTQLSSQLIGANFHTGSEGENGPVAHAINFPAGELTAIGTWTELSDEDISGLLFDQTIYINIETDNNPSGELRGQVYISLNASASLNSNSEVPPVSNDQAIGNAGLFIDSVNHTVLYFVDWANLSGLATAAHFHRGKPGMTGPVVQPISFSEGDSSTVGLWENLSDLDLADVINGNMYINIHTAANPTGEIRGQVNQVHLFTAAISPGNEIPLASGSDAAGTGFVRFIYDQNTGDGEFLGSFITEGTTGTISAAHIHKANIAVNGPVFLPLQAEPANTQWYGLATVSGADAASLISGGMYANFHTAMFPNGEARGQLIPGAINLPAPPISTSVPIVTMRQQHSTVTATVNPALAEIQFEFDMNLANHTGSIVLYSILGQRVAIAEATSHTARVSTKELTPGVYLAQLVVDGTAVATCRVVVGG